MPSCAFEVQRRGANGLRPCAPVMQRPQQDVGACVQGKAVDDIINQWNAELERRSRAFVKQAEALAQADRHILTNRHTLLELEEQLRKVGTSFLRAQPHSPSHRRSAVLQKCCLSLYLSPERFSAAESEEVQKGNSRTNRYHCCPWLGECVPSPSPLPSPNTKTHSLTDVADCETGNF